ncbi:MAG: HAMP domain-containing protein [Clostridiales bacterium]|nr:HAMP domain-containing protein [Clostridiales bacterium]
MKKKKKNIKSSLFLYTSAIIFLCLLCNLALFYGMNLIAYKLDYIKPNGVTPIFALSILLIISVVIGAVVSFLVAKNITKPFNEIKDAINEISKGNFDVKIKPVKSHFCNEMIANFNKMALELKSIETLKADFVSNVSHEFKTPLSVVQSYSKILRRKDLDEATRKKYETVLDNNIQKLTNLTNNILNLTKIENQQILIDKTEYSLDEQIRQSILFLEPKWKSKEIEFDLNLRKTTYYGSKSLMEQVWQNLIENAIKFSNNKGKISISLTTEENGKIVAQISDDGIGMNEETLKHIFEKFYQGDTSHSSAGNGLGLALVKKIIAVCDGKISVTSKEGEGSTFTITL